MPRGNNVAAMHPANCEIFDRTIDSSSSPDPIKLDSIMSAPNSLIQPAERNEVEAAGDERPSFWDEILGAVTGRIGNGTSARSTAWSLAPYGWLALLILTNAVVSALSSAYRSGALAGLIFCTAARYDNVRYLTFPSVLCC
jgi:hypothetical protein